MYTLDHQAGNKDAPALLQTSANRWQQLAGRMSGCALGMGAGRVAILPVFSAQRFLGDDGDDLSSFSPSFNDIEAGGSDSFESVPDLLTSGNLVSQSNLNTLYPLNASGQPQAPLSVEQPLANIEAETPSPTQSVQSAIAAGATIPGTAAYQYLINAGLTAAQIAAGQTSAPVAATTTGTAAQIVPGVSNTTVLIGGLVVLMVLASGKKK
jgi:hypothetical protein